jgi:hypothetical protein
MSACKTKPKATRRLRGEAMSDDTREALGHLLQLLSFFPLPEAACGAAAAHRTMGPCPRKPARAAAPPAGRGARRRSG